MEMKDGEENDRTRTGKDEGSLRQEGGGGDENEGSEEVE